MSIDMKDTVMTESHSNTREVKMVGDRFIPNRGLLSSDRAAMLFALKDAENKNPAPDAQSFRSHLAQTLLNDSAPLNTRVLSFKEKAPRPSEDHIAKVREQYANNKIKTEVDRKFRHISCNPEKILDAPELKNDYYLNLMDWSSTDLMGIALDNCVYLWNASTGAIDMLMELKDASHLTSLKFTPDGSHVSLGTSANDVQIFNVEKKKRVRTLHGHDARVSVMAWNKHVLTTAGRDSVVINHDVRVQEHVIGTWYGHQQEVCGMKWDGEGKQLATGGNDNMVAIWDAAMISNSSANRGECMAVHTFTDHTAAVKALDWCPFQRGLLATGGGTQDRHIRFYNTPTGKLINSVDTNSQVCSLVWSPTGEKELVSAHGFSQNQLTVWKYPTMVRMAELTGHSQRVLHTALSPDGTTVCSAGADETIRFWKIWEQPQKKKAVTRTSSKLDVSSMTIR